MAEAGGGKLQRPFSANRTWHNIVQQTHANNLCFLSFNSCFFSVIVGLLHYTATMSSLSDKLVSTQTVYFW